MTDFRHRLHVFATEAERRRDLDGPRPALDGRDVIFGLNEGQLLYASDLRAALSEIERLTAEREEARNEALREAAALCRATTMEVPMRRTDRKYGGLYAAGEAVGGGAHEGMGYADLLEALIKEDTPDD